ncbi:response regulator receiver domain-containing protein [Jejuia pallidilutea]|uniref:Response regulator receiver domain-containing protein n=1 Tax=Jejuia pallidilutea TaxID=504487 RepID=A0A362X7U7_9FLAO|nr:response regulator [Jejuia pallidilutea]PQV47449.1 response regulator receiver domain-containing protein [Jejuia pallidilutea]
MSDTINVLIVEDEPIIIGLLESIFKQLSDSNNNWYFKLNLTQNCDTAMNKIEKAVLGKPFDLALLDISIPPSKQKKYYRVRI